VSSATVPLEGPSSVAEGERIGGIASEGRTVLNNTLDDYISSEAAIGVAFDVVQCK
jgi:hypothetical protein